MSDDTHLAPQVSASAPSPSKPLPPASLTPYPGQPDAEVDMWFRANYPSGRNEMSERKYAGALYNNPADPKPDRDDDPAAEKAWYERLTEYQERILSTARARKAADPKVIAKRKKDLANWPEYQETLAQKRKDYAAEQAAKGLSVRPYRRRTTKPDAATLKAEQIARNEGIRAGIRNSLIAKENPFKPRDLTEKPPEDLGSKLSVWDDRDEYLEKWETKKRTDYLKHQVCEVLLKDGQFTMSGFADEAWLNEVTDEEAEAAFKSVVGILRVAKAISRKGDTIRLHADIIEEQNANDMSGLPHFGMC